MNEIEEQCIEIITNFLNNDMPESNRLFDYNFNVDNIDADRLPVILAVYILLWNDTLFCKDNYSGKNFEIKLYKEEIKVQVDEETYIYSGETLNTKGRIYSKYKKIINDEKELKKIEETFSNNYLTLGNFIPFPKVKKHSLNNAKNQSYADQFDLYLNDIKKFYIEKTNHYLFKNNKDAKKDDFNYDIGCSSFFSNILKENIEYFKRFKSFNNYIDKNFLQDYIDNGDVIDLFNRKEDKFLPKSTQTIKEYFSKFVSEDNNKKLLLQKRAGKMRDKFENQYNDFYQKYKDRL